MIDLDPCLRFVSIFRTRRSKAAGNWKVDRNVLESVMSKVFPKKEVHPSQEVESMCVTVGVDMDNFDREMQVLFFAVFYLVNV